MIDGLGGQATGIFTPLFGEEPFGGFPWPGLGVISLHGSPQATLTLTAESSSTITLRGHEEV